MFSRLGLKTLWMILALCLAAPGLRAQGSEYSFPQVADGVSGNIFYSTSFLLNNVANTVSSVTIRFFRSNGTAWTVDLRSIDRNELAGRRSTVTFNLQPRETVELFTGGADPLSVGWARVESALSIEASEVFQVFSTNPIVVRSEAGVLPSPAATQFSFYATVSSNEPVTGTNIDTGLAIANLNGAAAQITGTLFSRSGSQLAQRNISLPSGNHTAMFVSQIFNNITFPSPFHGTVRLSSNVNIAVVGLRQTSGSSDTIATLAINPDSTLSHITIYDREPNDTRETAQPITAFPAEVIGTMNSPGDSGDIDFFSMNLRAGDVVYVFVVADLVGSPLDDSIIIRDSAGANVAQNDNVAAGLRDPFLRYQVPSSGIYFIDHGSVLTTSSRSAHYRLHVMVR